MKSLHDSGLKDFINMVEQTDAEYDKVRGITSDMLSEETIKNIRKKIAEECRERINQEIEWAYAAEMPINLTIDKILRIIRGD